MPTELISLSPSDVIQITDNRFVEFGNLLIVEEVGDAYINAYLMVNGEKYKIQLRWGEFQYVGKARVIFKE